MRFLLDMNLPRALAERLREEGHDAIHAYDAGQGNLEDRDIFRRAAADKRIVITLDLDFGEIASNAHRSETGLILLRLRLTRHPYLWDRLRVAIAETNRALDGGAIVLVEDARIRVRRTGPED